MPRPKKCRKVCSLPHCTHFVPSPQSCGQEIVMTVDEYETIRLIDFEELTQEQCSDQMEIARTTVQAIYSNARKKLAQCIVQGRQMSITGGDVQICERRSQSCGCRCVRRGNTEERMGKKMKIAVTYEDGQVFQHFGHTEHFKVYEVHNGSVQSASMLDTNGSGHGALADILKQNSVDTLICGGIGAGAKNALAKAGIQLYGGVVGTADQVIADLLSDKLNFIADAECDHHHDDGGHGCHGDCHKHTQ